MADTILGGDLTVYYLAENRRKQIRWTGGTAKTATRKMIEVYDASEDLMTGPAQQDDGLIYSAETPGEYTIGIIDAGDNEPWFTDFYTMQHIVGDFQNFTGCALKTSGWTRSLPGNGSGNIGIVVVPVTSGGAIVVGDIGFDISHADGDAGTLLDVVITGGATDYLFVRPDSNALANDFNSVSGNLTCNANVSVQSAAAHTGEMVWANPYSQGALQPDTHVYLIQNGVKVTSFDQTNQDWWPDGQIDRAVPIKNYQTAAFPLIDGGYITVRANKYGTKYTYSIIRANSVSGGNIAAGLSSGADITNTTGYKRVTLGTSAGVWGVGDEILGATSGARAIITAVASTNPTIQLDYFLVGDPLTDFNGSEAINNQDDTGTSVSSGATSLQGPALASWFDGSAFPTYAFANAQFDVNDDAVNEQYGITIDVNQASLAQLHERNKYVTRRGAQGGAGPEALMDSINGEQWIGIDYAIFYSAFTATIAEGDIATGATSGATGTVVSFPGGTTSVMLLRNSRGTFLDTEIINFTSGGNMSAAQVTSVEVIVPVAESSFGTLAGVTFFASRGVLLTDYKSAEENNWTTIDAAGVVRARPTTITMSILNLLQHDWASCFRLLSAGGNINKTEYTATGGEAIGAATIDLTTTIAADVPGKTAGGRLVLVDVSDDNQEYVLRYSSYDAATGLVTLANIVIAAADAATTTTIQETGAFTTARVGDLVLNITQSNAVSYITEVVDNNNVVIFPPITGQTTADNIEINAVPVVTTASDRVYFPIILAFRETGGTESASMVYVAPIEALARVRNTGDATIKIKGFSSPVSIGSGGGQASTTRITNTVYGS